MPKEEPPKSAPPKDPILGEILRGEKTKEWVIKYHQHDSLLEHRPEEAMTEEEVKQAWQEFDNEKKGIFTHMYDRPAYNPYQNLNIDMNNLMGWQNLNNHAVAQNHNIVYNKQNWVQTIQVS